MKPALQLVPAQPKQGEAVTISRVVKFPVDRQCGGSLQSLKLMLAKDARPWPVRAYRFLVDAMGWG